MFQLADVIDFAEVGTNNVSRPPRAFHCALRFQKFLAASAHQNDFGSRARVGESERAPNPLAGSGDDSQAGVEIVHQPLVERIGRVDINAIGSDDMIVLETDAADAGLPRVWLEIERHSFLEYDRRILRRRTKVRSLPGIDA